MRPGTQQAILCSLIIQNSGVRRMDRCPLPGSTFEPGGPLASQLTLAGGPGKWGGSAHSDSVAQPRAVALSLQQHFWEWKTRQGTGHTGCLIELKASVPGSGNKFTSPRFHSPPQGSGQVKTPEIQGPGLRHTQGTRR